MITVPVWYNFTVEPRDGFLQGLRELCTENNIVLIFDEVISGFRTALGGGQEYYNITPDLATFAKGIGGGVSLACLAGRDEIMGLIASGALLLAVAQSDGTRVVKALKEAGIPAAKIGRVVPQEDGITLRGASGGRPLPHFDRDEIARLFE